MTRIDVAARLALVAFALLVSAPAAHAHATLIAAEPADGALLARAPATLRLTFNEPVSPLVLRLVGASGHRAALTDFATEGTAIVIRLPTLGPGTHAMSWRVVSADGHPVGGTMLFSVGAPGVAPPTGESGSATARAALWAAKFALYLGLFVGIGGAFFRAWAPEMRAGESVIGAALIAGLVATPLSVGLQGLDALELPLSALASRATWETGLGTAYGLTVVVADIALFAALFGLAAPRAETARVLALGALVGCGLALSVSGHASAAEPQALMRPAVFVHAVGVAFWIGALVPLAAALRGGDGRAALTWFSRAIPFVLAAMVLAGLVLAIVQLGSVAALWSTAYGIVLSAKLAVVLVLLALAGVNRFRSAPRAASGDERARKDLLRAIRGEIILAMLILGLVATWRFTPPPRALALGAAAPAFVHIHTDKAMADVTLEPGRVGLARASVVIMRGDFTPLEPKEVTLILANPAAGIEPIRRAATLRDGVWQTGNVMLPVPGRWEVRVDVLISDFEKMMLEDSVEIRPSHAAHKSVND